MGERCLKKGQWGSSVLDSVVGAFLTQNVADTLSSQAFMMLAARFPPPDLLDSASQPSCKPGPGQLANATGILSESAPDSNDMHLGNTTNALSQAAKDVQQYQQGMPGQEGVLEAGSLHPMPADRTAMSQPNSTGVAACQGQLGQDSVDWEAVLAAPAAEVAEAIKCRGMHQILAVRIQVGCTASASAPAHAIAQDSLEQH